MTADLEARRMSDDVQTETLAKALYEALQWSGCAGSRWENQRGVMRDRWLSNADALAPHIARLIAEAEERGAARVRELEAVLRELVTLKDGPRDEDYQRRKPLAWEAARAALTDKAQPNPQPEGTQ